MAFASSGKCYYDNVFREPKPSWPEVHQGLIEMRQKYPRSFDLLNRTALLSTLGGTAS
jgi:hypothetical protein